MWKFAIYIWMNAIFNFNFLQLKKLNYLIINYLFYIFDNIIKGFALFK